MPITAVTGANHGIGAATAIAPWGRIVSLASGSRNGFPGEVSHGAARAAMENYTMAAAIELADIELADQRDRQRGPPADD